MGTFGYFSAKFVHSKTTPPLQSANIIMAMMMMMLWLFGTIILEALQGRNSRFLFMKIDIDFMPYVVVYQCRF